MSRATNGWPAGNASCVASDQNGVVWVGTTSHGLLRYQNGQFKNWRVRNGLAAENVHGVVVTAAEDVWITFANALQRFRHGQFETITLPPGTRSLRAMAEDTVGNIWVG